jgi:protein farnesyltransferase subunit beta
LASTYSAILSLLILGTEEAYKIINRPKLYEFLMRIKNKDGSFCLNEKGEIDMRGVYIAIIISDVLNI